MGGEQCTKAVSVKTRAEGHYFTYCMARIIFGLTYLLNKKSHLWYFYRCQNCLIPSALHKVHVSDMSVNMHDHTLIAQIHEVFATWFSSAIVAKTMLEDMLVCEQYCTQIPPTTDKLIWHLSHPQIYWRHLRICHISSILSKLFRDIFIGKQLLHIIMFSLMNEKRTER